MNRLSAGNTAKLHRGRFRWITGIAAASAVIVATGCTAGGSESGSSDVTLEEMAPINIVAIDANPESAPVGTAWKDYVAAAEEASDGKITFTHHWSSSMIPASEMPEGIASGIANMGVIQPVYNPSAMPITGWLSGFASLGNGNFPVGLLQSVGAHSEAILDSDEMVHDFSSKGLHLLAPIYAMQQFGLLCKEPVTDAASASGKTARVSGELWAQEAESIGLDPVTLAADELYEGFQRGIVDCFIGSPETAYNFGLLDIGKEYSPIPFSGYNATYLVVNQEFWDGLPTVAQDILWEALSVFLTGYQDKSLELHKAFAEDSSVNFNDVSDDVLSTLAGHQATALENLVANAPSVMNDPEGFFASYESALKRWEGVVINDLGFEELGTDSEAWREAYTQVWDLGSFQQKLGEIIFTPGAHTR